MKEDKIQVEEDIRQMEEDEIQEEDNLCFSAFDFWLMSKHLPPLDFLGKASKKREEYESFLDDDFDD